MNFSISFSSNGFVFIRRFFSSMENKTLSLFARRVVNRFKDMISLIVSWKKVCWHTTWETSGCKKKRQFRNPRHYCCRVYIRYLALDYILHVTLVTLMRSVFYYLMYHSSLRLKSVDDIYKKNYNRIFKKNYKSNVMNNISFRL